MRLLLDTHALLWALETPKLLPANVRRAVTDPSNDVYVSAASTWEIGIKVGLRQLVITAPDLEAAIGQAGFRPLPVTLKHGLEVKNLPGHHRDPFDRLLVIQATLEGLQLVTADRQLARYAAHFLELTSRSMEQ